MKKTIRTRTVVLLAGAAAVVGAALPLGALAAQGTDQPGYDVNARGLTVGTIPQALSPETEPDLIFVTGNSGTKGYVYKTDLNDPVPANPAAAAAFQAKVAGTDRVIPVFEEDGTTQIDTFTIHYSTPTQ